MKTCNKCSAAKLLTDFFKDKNNKTDGRYSICKACKQSATYKWRDENREEYNAQHSQWAAKNYQRLRLLRYKLSPEQHAQMLLDQKGTCAICNKLPQGKRPLCVDHDHYTGKVRGLLCYGCNRALHVLETKALLIAAMAYLDGYK